MAKRTKSGIKRVRSSKKRRSRNIAAKVAVKEAIKSAEKAIKTQAANISEVISATISVIDKAVERGILHINKAARKKSRLVKKIKKV